ncbi:1,2-dihydroxy-3-keto-5-methylthiopentene dioxygenase [Gyrodon lividus]|nr:1,2-dihydroxy-3-keto-5-methylthiopentene dioxygenase [Gyrodon lividus]
MRAYYLDDMPGDQRLPHDSGKPVDGNILKSIGVLHWYIPVPADEDYRNVEAIAQERGSMNKDVISITKEGLGDQYQSQLKIFYDEHIHEKEEIRYVLEGSGFLDVREHNSDSWIRCQIDAGDLMILPAGIYHRFILDEKNMLKAMRLFKDESQFVAHNRGEAVEANPYRVEYLKSITAN